MYQKLNIHTWNAAAEFVRSFGNEVIIKAIFQRTENNDGSCIVHCNGNKPRHVQ